MARLARAVRLAIAVLGLLAASGTGEAQTPGRVARIGYLGNLAPSPASAHWDEAFRQGLRERGWVEGQNLVIERRYADGKLERLPELAAELVRLQVDLIVTSLDPQTRAARQATPTIPIVMILGVDPVGSGFIHSLARPGGNITGLTVDVTPEIWAKRLELLKEAAPAVSRVALLWNRGIEPVDLYRKEADAAARKLGVTLQDVEVRTTDGIEGALAAITKGRAAALLVPVDPVIFTQRRRVLEFAARHRLPAIYGIREMVEAGGLMSYGPMLSDLFRRAGLYVDKLLKGARAAELPVERPTRLEMAVNLKTAKTLGLTLPRSILVRADHLIK